MKEYRKKRAHSSLFYLHEIIENANYGGRGDRERLQNGGDGYVHDLDYGDGFMDVYVSQNFSNGTI